MKQCLMFLKGQIPSESRINRMRELDIFFEDAKASECLDEVENKPGIYVIVGQSVKYPYPNGNSPVIYIGTSKHLKTRLSEHISYYKAALNDWNANKYWADSRYNYIISHNAVVYYMYTYNDANKDLESKAIEAFYDRYKAIPVGNGARSFRRRKKCPVSTK